jgi:hypothetical protein
LSPAASTTAAGARSARPLATVALVLATPLLARLAPARLSRVLARAAGPARRPHRSAEAASARVERAIALASRLRRQTCLTRGLSRYIVLRRAGLPVELVFGLGASAGAHAGHCWLELDGAPYLEETDPRRLFPEILRVPAAGSGR